MLLWGAALFTVSLALLTCTPPNFDDDPITDPLSLTPLEPQLVAGSQLDFTADGGTPPYMFAVASGLGSINASSGLYTAPDQPESAAVKVTDHKGRTTETPVSIKPSTLMLSPDHVSIFQGSSVVITGSGGTLDYTGSASGGGTLIQTSDSTWRFDATDDDPTPWVITVTDESVPMKTAWAYITVTAPPSALTISPETITLTRGDTFTFNAGGGAGGYTYEIASGVGSITPVGVYTAGQLTPGGYAGRGQSYRCCDGNRYG